MVGIVGETRLISPVHPTPIPEGVIGWAQAEVSRGAPRLDARVYDHLTVTSDIARYIPVARAPVILPAAPNVHEVELALIASPLLYVQCESHLEMG